MRVIAGDKKGSRLVGPKGKDIRPTEDRIKESLFNILGGIDENTIILDLFAGSGGIGIEFLSRGARMVYFVDQSNESIRCIKVNLDHTKLQDRARIIKSDAFKAIKHISNDDIIFDYIFIDPPYGHDLPQKIINRIYEFDILKDDGMMIIEHEKKIDLRYIKDKYLYTDCRNYGNKSLSFFTINKGGHS